ncbi:MAG: hypothetical protein ACI80K_000408 [Paracoccaceae bacterium]|jgi:hypothetical protein
MRDHSEERPRPNSSSFWRVVREGVPKNEEGSLLRSLLVPLLAPLLVPVRPELG